MRHDMHHQHAGSAGLQRLADFIGWIPILARMLAFLIAEAPKRPGDL